MRQAPSQGTEIGRFPTILPLLAMALVPGLSVSAAPFVVLALGGLWLLGRPSRREVFLALPLMAVATLLLAAGPIAQRQWNRPSSRQAEFEKRYAQIWDELDRQATLAADEFPDPPTDSSQILAAFELLNRKSEGGGKDAVTLYLVDPVGEVVAWAGPGLLHELQGQSLPPWGRTFRASFSAASLLSVRPIRDRGPNWRVVAGRTYAVDSLPFTTADQDSASGRHWSLTYAGSAQPDLEETISLPGTPVLVMPETESSELDSGETYWRRQAGSRLERLAWALLAACLLAIAAVRTRHLLPQIPDGGRAEIGRVETSGRLQPGALGLAAILTLARAGGLDWNQSLILMAAAGFALASWSVAPRLSGLGRAMVLGGLAPLLMTWLALRLQGDLLGPLDLATGPLLEPGVMATRLAFAALAIGLFGLVGQRDPSGDSGRETPAWLAAAAFVVAAACAEYPMPALALLAVAGSLAGAWRHGWAGLARWVFVGYTCLLSILAAATSWEVAHRMQLRRWLAEEALPSMAPPSETELEDFEGALVGHFAQLDLSQLVPHGIEDLDRRDLAYEIWRHSPMAQRGFSSALAVVTPAGATATFSFGLPMTEDGFVDWSPARWNVERPADWRLPTVQGVAPITLQGEPWGDLRYWLVPRPGYRLEMGRLESLSIGLLRGGPRQVRWASEILTPALYGLFDSGGSAIVSPWKRPPRLSTELLEPEDGGRGRDRVATPDGMADAYSAAGEDGIRVLFLPRLSMPQAVERMGGYVLGVAIPLLLAGLVLAFTVLPLQVLTATGRRALRSYSTRLAIVYTAVALVPLILVSLFTIRVAGERLREEQIATGRAALESAQTVLGDYILSLEPGFGIDVALDNDLLAWLSAVVHHEVNLYWQSMVYASSKPELFASGLLPNRIPGEVYSRLTLLDHQLGSRTNRADDVEYLEIYAPLRIPGFATDQVRLFLSVPLLAQQEEVATAIDLLRRNVLLATGLLIVALLALGARLARSFVTPLSEIVEGTQRIAEGEASLDLQPADLELATLVDAIDRMAGRIAEAREGLVREKRVVERMVENITAGIVSIDLEGRVMMANRAATELLETRVGDSLRSSLAGVGALTPVAEFIDSTGDRLERRTVSLPSGEAELREWSLVWVPVAGTGEPSALLVVEDVSEQVRGQRLEAWAEMARIIAHEIKNPLTPIRLSTEHLVEVYRNSPETFEQVLESCSTNILRQVEELREISSEFSTYSRIPTMHAARSNLVDAVREVVDAYRTGPPSGIEFEFVTDRDQMQAWFDPNLLGRAVRNLIENALRAMTKGGVVRIAVSTRGGETRIEVADQGSGVQPDVLGRIFDPYFSTHDSGTGLGLAISRRIADQHGGRIEAHNRPEGGLAVTIALPSSDFSGGEPT